MKRRFLLLFSLTLITVCCDAARRSWQQPNVVLLVAEGLGREWLGCYGGQEVLTPEIDRLAANGVRFETCYAAPMPSISRVELLTGRYPFRNGWLWENDVPTYGPPELDSEREICFPRVLQKAGYHTLIAGVWGLNDLSRGGEVLRAHGFDEQRVSTKEKALTRSELDRSVEEFITAKRDQPFLACYFVPAAPSPTEFKQHVLGLDRLVGRLTEVIRQEELDRQTMVVLTSACGAEGVGVRAWDGRWVKGGKGTLTDVGINVPLIVSGSYWVERGRTSRQLVDFTDLLPTLADLAGARLPHDRTLDGRSFVGLLNGRGMRNPREWVFSQHGANRIVRNARYKLYSNGRYYDVLSDPLEEQNLHRTNNSEMIAERERLAKILRSLPADEPLAFPYARRIIVRRPR